MWSQTVPTSPEDTPPAPTFANLCPGDVVAVQQLDGPLTYQGVIDLAVPEQELVWIRCGAFNERKLLAATQYRLVKVST